MAQQQELPLTPKVTGWLRGTPKFFGWYNTRVHLLVDESEKDEPARVRRFWNGEFWSRPCTIGEGNEIAASRCQTQRSSFKNDDIEYQGLQEEHPGGYYYALQSRAETTRRKLAANV